MCNGIMGSRYGGLLAEAWAAADSISVSIDTEEGAIGAGSAAETGSINRAHKTSANTTGVITRKMGLSICFLYKEPGQKEKRPKQPN